MFRILYPTNETKREILITSSIVGILFYLLLIIYQPFGTSEFKHFHKYLLLFPYAIITTFSFFSINLILSKQERKWTIGSELCKSVLILIIISSFSYFYNALFVSKVSLSLENYLYMFFYTSALGFPIVAIYILARFIYLNHKKYHFVKTNHIDEEFIKSIEPNEAIRKLCIVADYSKFRIEIEPDDFLYAESADNYCIIHFNSNGVRQKQMIRISLTKLLDQIQTATIQRVHRSFIVNLKKVNHLKGNSAGYKISIDNAERELNISRKYIESILPIIKEFAACP